jgi:hypothetical protein
MVLNQKVTKYIESNRKSKGVFGGNGTIPEELNRL